MLNRRCCIPIACQRVIEFVQQDGDVTPWQLSNSLLDYRVLGRPPGGEPAHIEKVAPREASHSRELGTQIGCEPADDPAPPRSNFLLRQNLVANLPIQLDQLRVDHALSTNLSVSHTGLQTGEEVRVPVRERYNGVGHIPHSRRPLQHRPITTGGMPQRKQAASMNSSDCPTYALPEPDRTV